eukprot:s789_g8.t2
MNPKHLAPRQEQGYECVLMQGSGTAAVEAMLGTVPQDGKVLLVINGAYGHRQTAICSYAGINYETLVFEDSEAINVEKVLSSLRQSSATHLSLVHHETTAGVINPLEELLRKVKAEFPQIQVLVDSMSGFGAYDLDMTWGIDFAVSSANKCIEDESSVSGWVCRINDAWYFEEFTKLTSPRTPPCEGRAAVTETNMPLIGMLKMLAYLRCGPLCGERDAQPGHRLHAEGRCSPCIFYNSPLGCGKGDACDFCHHGHRNNGGKQNRPRKDTRESMKMSIEECLHLPDDQLQLALEPILQHPYARGLIQSVLETRAEATDWRVPLEPGEGVPGFAYVLCQVDALKQSKGTSRSLTMDIYDQWANMEATGQFRYTPPTHAILAFQQALAEFHEEGGVAARKARYTANYEVLAREMQGMGFEFYVPEGCRSYCICTFKTPEHPNFHFQTFYNLLAEQGFVIYPGKLSKGNSFRIGIIGRLFPKDCEMLCLAVRKACESLQVPLPL